MQPCGYCGKDVPQLLGKRKKEYCNDVCRQLAYRKRKHSEPATLQQKHQADQDAALVAELAELRAKVADQANEIEELTSQIITLRERLDVERRYLSDITPRHFKSWLKKQPTSPLVTQMFADPLFPPRGPRSLYEAHIRAHYGPVERDDFVRLWKLMLLQS